MWFSLLIIVILFTFHCSSFSTTVCDRSDPNQMGLLQFADSTCKPEPRSHEFNEVNYKIYTIQPETIKFPGYIFGRWQQIKRITMNFFGQIESIPDKIPLETTAAECRIMQQMDIWRRTRRNWLLVTYRHCYVN